MVGIHHDSQMTEPGWVDDVLGFWFGGLSEAHWFCRDEQLDARIRSRFLGLRERLVAQGGGGVWTQRSLLAAIIVLDQFSRNMFRDDPRAYAADSLARQLSMRAIENGYDVALCAQERLFVYLPFEHSEDRENQERSVKLIASLGNEDWTGDAIKHKETIDRFGRFPHRNGVLGRHSTPDECAFLRLPTSRF